MYLNSPSTVWWAYLYGGNCISDVNAGTAGGRVNALGGMVVNDGQMLDGQIDFDPPQLVCGLFLRGECFIGTLNLTARAGVRVTGFGSAPVSLKVDALTTKDTFNTSTGTATAAVTDLGDSVYIYSPVTDLWYKTTGTSIAV